MKGMILAAGKGRRLRPLTDQTPKPMLPIAGRPLLEHIITHLCGCGITDLAINLHHLPGTVMKYFGNGSRWGVKIRYSLEDQLLSSAGGVKRLQSFFDETFLVYSGNVFTQVDLHPMIAFHRQAGGLATVGLYRVPDPWNQTIAQLGERQSIIRFAEKPPRDQIFSPLANAGIYVLEPEVLNRIPVGQPYDFGRDLFPAMLADGVRMSGYIIDDRLIDIGSPDKYEEAKRLASDKINSNIKPSNSMTEILNLWISSQLSA